MNMLMACPASTDGRIAPMLKRILTLFISETDRNVVVSSMALRPATPPPCSASPTDEIRLPGDGGGAAGVRAGPG